jgi:hypothetical protein
MASVTAASVLALGWVSGCSVLYDLDTKQCSVDADCTALGAAFEGLACVDNLCQEPPINGCQSNAECIDQFGRGFEPWACIEKSEPGALRRENECVALTTTECPTILPQGRDGELWLDSLRTDNPLILGGSGLIGGSTLIDNTTRNFELALTELTQANQGLPGGRQVVMIACQALFDDDEQLDREMNHLANVVKVPGTVSTYLAEDLQRAFNDYGKPAQMFFMSPLDSDPALAALQDDGLLWHIGPAFDVVGRAYAPLFKRTLEHLGLTNATDVKVATVMTSDSRQLSSMVEPSIEQSPDKYGISFNGRTLVENRDSTHEYIRLDISADETVPVSQHVDAILALLPNIIISAADTQFIQRMIPAIEAGWPDDSPPKPFYLLSPVNYNDPNLQDLIETDSTLASRIAGVNGAAAADPTVLNQYIGRWKAAFPDPPEITNALGYENFYDAAYYLIYAAAGAGQSLAGGQSLKNGMNRLLGGTGPFSVGPTDMARAMGTLASSGSATIQLNGTLGPPEFNPVDGTRTSDGSVWCIDASGIFHSDVLRYVPNNDDPTQASLTGDFPCFDFGPPSSP